MQKWLPVIDYAVNKRVSISTLRRRIKSQSLEHRLENGRYLILAELDSEGANLKVETTASESLLVVQNLISEIKKAYSLVLAEKEEIIQQLKSEIENLKHINQFLEFQIMNGPHKNEMNSEIEY